MKWRNIAILASLTFFGAAITAAPKKAPPPKPAKVDPKAAAAAAKAEAEAKAKAEAAAKAKAEEPAPVEGFFVKKVKAGDGKEITLRLGGYVDAYYAYNYRANGDTRSNNHPQGTSEGGVTGMSTGPNNGRIFESANNQVSLGLVQTKFEMGNDDWQIVADLIHGPNAELTNFNNIRGATSSTTSTAIKQAYVSAMLIKNLKLTAGQFSTHIGYEVVESYQNPNYMLGNLFAYGPFYHTGAKLDYTLLDGKIGIMAGGVNGWDLQADNNADKTVIGQITLKPTSSLSVFLNYAGGNETSRYNAAVSNVGGMRHIGDVVIQFQPIKMIKIGLNFVYGENKVNTNTAAQKWGGAAGYLSFIFSDNFTLSWRTDYFEDKQLARGLMGQTSTTNDNGATILGNTLTANISMYGGHVMIRPEVKYDIADKPLYGTYAAGAAPIIAEAHKTNWTALIAVTGIY